MRLVEEKKGRKKELPNISMRIPLRFSLNMNDPFYIFLGINGHTLRNSILNSGIPIHIMSSSIMKKLGLKLSKECPNKIILNCDELKVCGIVEGKRAFFHTYPEKEFTMNIVIVEMNPAWGMIVSQLVGDLNLSIIEDNSIIYLPWKEKSYVSILRHEFFAHMIVSSQEPNNDLEEESIELWE